MESRPLVTIGIPTYNRAEGFLRDALHSALRQTYENLEIVVSDNGSTDGTEAYVKSINDLRIRYFRHSPSIAPHENFNFCLSQARGMYFSLLHDDDVLDDDFVETCMDAAQDSPRFGLIRTGLRGIDDEGALLFETQNLVGGIPAADFYLAWFRGKTPMHLCSTLFNTEKLRAVGGFNSTHQLFNDVVAEIRLAACYERMDIPDIKASFRRHIGSRTSAHKIRYWCEESIELLDLICGLVPAREGELRKEGKRFFIRHNLRLVRSMPSATAQAKSYWVIFWVFDKPIRPFVKELRYRLRRTNVALQASEGA